MHKYFYVLYALFMVGMLCPDAVAQNSDRTPLPDWVFEKPERSNETFWYLVERAEGKTEAEAINNALTEVFIMASKKLAIPLSLKEIREAVANGANAEQLSQRFNIPLNIVCCSSESFGNLGLWLYRILCQIPEAEYVNNAQFDVFNDCDKHERYDQIRKKYAAKSNENDLGTLKEVEDNESVTKSIQEGHILITIGDKVYTIQGQEVK